MVSLDIDAKAYQSGHDRVNQVLQKQPNSAACLLFLRGKLYTSEGKFDLAQEALLKAIDLDPNFNRAYDLLVPIFRRANKLPQALNEMNAPGEKADDVARYYSPPPFTTYSKDYNKSRDSYEKVLTIDSNSVLALNNLAFLYAGKLNDLNRAAELAQKARSIAPTNPSGPDTLGWITYKQGNYQQAVDSLNQSAAKSPYNAEIQFHLGMAAYMMGQSDAALSALKKRSHLLPSLRGRKKRGASWLSWARRAERGGISQPGSLRHLLKNSQMIRLG